MNLKKLDLNRIPMLAAIISEPASPKPMASKPPSLIINFSRIAVSFFYDSRFNA
jgi:hypothetical protein